MSAGSRTSRRASARPLSRIGIAVLAALVVFGSAGIFAAFTSNDNATQNVETGNVLIRITNDANTGHITDTFSNRAAGDTITRTFTVQNLSSLALSVLTLKLTAPSTDLLISDPEGLTAQIWT